MQSQQHPKIHFKSPTFRNNGEDPDQTSLEGGVDPRSSATSAQTKRAKRRNLRPLPLNFSTSDGAGDNPNVYLGSFVRTPRSSFDVRALGESPAPSPKPSVSRMQLEPFLPSKNPELNSYGVEEHRVGFFEAYFYRPLERNSADLKSKAFKGLPAAFQKHHPLSIRYFFPRQARAIVNVGRSVGTSSAGIKVFKSFLAYFICYIICLIPASAQWLGRYSYIMPISAIINHAGRPIGSQIDGLFMTTVGTVAGLGWGSLALFVSTSTVVSKQGYGGIIATFLVLFTAVIGWLRAVFLRLYQAVICAGFAVFYICLTDISSDVSWHKVFNYGIPWVLGQAVCILVALFVFPDAGSRSLARRFHVSLGTIRAGLQLPQAPSGILRRDLAWEFVVLSQAVRDFTIEFAISRYRPDEVRTLRNLVQAIIRSTLSIPSQTKLFEQDSAMPERVVDSFPSIGPSDENSAHLVREFLKDPTRKLIDAMRTAIEDVDNVILHIGGQSRLNPPIASALNLLREAKSNFDQADATLLANPNLSPRYAKQPDAVDMLLFIHPVRQTADKVEACVEKVLQLQEANHGWRILAPSYPWRKAVTRTNAQVRHDRGGLTAGFYFQSKRVLDRMIADLQNTTYAPPVKPEVQSDNHKDLSVIGKYEQEKENNPNRSKKVKIRYQIWKILHRLQGFESRFALKVTIVTTLVSVPAWLGQSRIWWSANDSWWAVVIIWSQMHPRVGGTFQDLIVRCFCAVIGAVWGGFAFAARNGNPYVTAAFAAIFMIPMFYRFTQSPHPRSGLVGCLSFTVVSLAAYEQADNHSTVMITWTRGLAFVVGVVAALLVNWMLWPFIARHELRKSLSSMLLHSAVLYRSIISKYIYYKEGEPPGPDEVIRSEMLEGRLREGFVRIRQLLELTRHEMRLRGPFDPLPYSGLIGSCEAFFEHLVQVRQSSLYFQPTLLPSTASAPTAMLTSVRRDAVAAILVNLYILACALRTAQPVPKYLPSAAAARRRLLDRMAVVEAEIAAREKAQEVAATITAAAPAESSTTAATATSSHPTNDQAEEEDEGQRQTTTQTLTGKRRWADVYSYAYSGALTDIVGELQVMKRFCKEICGEVGWY